MAGDHCIVECEHENCYVHYWRRWFSWLCVPLNQFSVVFSDFINCWSRLRLTFAIDNTSLRKFYEILVFFSVKIHVFRLQRRVFFLRLRHFQCRCARLIRWIKVKYRKRQTEMKKKKLFVTRVAHHLLRVTRSLVSVAITATCCEK